MDNGKYITAGSGKMNDKQEADYKLSSLFSAHQSSSKSKYN